MDTPEGKPAVQEETLAESADPEEAGRRRARPPRCRGYRIRVNGDRYEVHEAFILGRQVLELANLVPPERYTLRVKVAGQPPRRVELDERVDLREPGVEKFKALPRDQTEG